MEQAAVVEIETDNETVTEEIAGLSEVESRALISWESYKRFCRRSVVEAWRCGVAFEEVFNELPTGEWEPWLKSKGISKSTADRLRLLAKSYGEVRQVDEFTSVDQALRKARSKRKGPAKKVEPQVGTEGAASPGTPEEAIGGDGTSQLPDDIESAQEIQELPDKLSETEDQLPVGEKNTAEQREINDKLREAEKKNTELRQENTGLRQENTEMRQKNTELRQENTEQRRQIERLKRRLEENGIPWESTPDDQQQIYPNSDFSVNRKDSESGGARTTAAPVSR